MELFEGDDGSVLMVDGDGSELHFQPAGGGAYTSPPGNFATLEKVGETFRYTTKEQTVYEFNENNQIASMGDRNGNVTQFGYTDDRLTSITDPVGLQTTFAYTGERITRITDPASRDTLLRYDSDGNLIEIVDPDGTSRKFDYDNQHHIIAEEDQRGNREETVYNFAGRAIQAIRKDGSVLQVAPVQGAGLYPPEATTSTGSAPVVGPISDDLEASYADASGNVTVTELDGAGQATSSRDGGGPLPKVERNEDNLVSTRTDGRQFETLYDYDDRGNVIRIIDEVASNEPTEPADLMFSSGAHFTVGSSPVAIATGDVDNDGIPDIVTANSGGSSVSILLGSGGRGVMDAPTRDVAVAGSSRDVAIGDVNGDGFADIISANGSISILWGDGDGTFDSASRTDLSVGGISIVEVADLDGDGNLDIAASGRNSSSVLSIFWGNGDGTFETSSVSTGGTVSTFSVGDLDGDGLLDLLSTDNGGSLLARTFLNQGDRSFSLSSSFDHGFRTGPFQTGTVPVLDAPLGDFDDDGDLDLVLIAHPFTMSLAFYLNQGNGSFLPGNRFNGVIGPADSGLFDDLNADGLPDLIANNNASENSSVERGALIFENQGGGTFNSQADLRLIGQPGSMPIDVVVTDIDGDRALDIVTANRGNNSISIFFNNADLMAVERRFEYDPTFNQMTKAIDELGRETIYEIDPANGNRLSVTRVVGSLGGGDDVVTSYTYTPEGLVDTMTDALNRVTDYDYNDRGLVEKVTFAVGTVDEAVRRFEYDLAGNVTAVVDENNNRTEYLYDELNRLEKTTYAKGTADEAEEITEYDEAGNEIATVDENGNRTEYEYDELNRQVKMTEADPDGDGPLESPTTTYEYDNNGNLVLITDPIGRQTQNRYDSRDRLVETIRPDGSREFARYDFDSNFTSSTDADGNPTNRFYDARGRLVRQVDSQGNETTYEYDVANQLVAITDRNGYRQEFKYDDLGRQTEVIDNEGTSITQYDPVGNVIAQIDPLNQKTEYKYDNRDRQIETIDALADPGKTTFDYDGVGNIISITDPVNNTTTFEYDDRYRLVLETNELNGTRRFIYDDVGNPLSVTDRNDRERQLVYDALNRQVAENWLDGSGNPIRTIASSYDAASQLIEISDPDSSYRYTYDDRGQLETVENGGNPDLPNVTLSYTYDDRGNISSVSDRIGSDAGATTTYTYDELERIREIAQTGSTVADKRIDLDYDPIGQIESIRRYDDLTGMDLVVETRYEYDEFNRLDRLTHDNLIGNIAAYDFTFDADDRITQIVDVDGTTTYTHDNNDRLTGVDRTDPTNPDESYNYDKNGNRTQSHVHGTNYVTGDNNQLLSDGTYNYTYDAEGNLKTQTEIATGIVEEFEWDYRNRLTAIVTRNASDAIVQQVEFDYDVWDRRIAKTVDADGEGVETASTTYFVYDRDNVLLEFENGETTPSQRYLHGPMTDQILASEDDTGTTLWHLSDHLGTVGDFVDNAGTLLNHRTYDSYGNLISQTDDNFSSRYGFTGREFDEETGLYYYRARYYDRAIGRFISEDPLSFSAGDPNLYAYVGNQPLTHVDPLGTTSMELMAMFAIADSQGGYRNPSGTTYNWDKIPPRGGYNKAAIDAVSWFYVIIEPPSRLSSYTPWGYSGQLRNDPSLAQVPSGGVANLRPRGSTGTIPTIDLAKERGTGRTHQTPGYERIEEVKFLYSGRPGNPDFCPLPDTERVYDDIFDWYFPYESPAPEPSPAPAPTPSPPRGPTIPWPDIPPIPRLWPDLSPA